MPAPAFEWQVYKIPVRRAEDSVAAEEVVEVHIPDFTPWAGPLDNARILLETAAEVEHALLVQYLYAASVPPISALACALSGHP